LSQVYSVDFPVYSHAHHDAATNNANHGTLAAILLFAFDLTQLSTNVTVKSGPKM